MVDSNKISMIAPRSVYSSTRSSAIVALIGFLFVASFQYSLYAENLHGLKLAAVIGGDAFFAVVSIYGMYRMIKPQLLYSIDKEGIQFNNDKWLWSEIEEFKICKQFKHHRFSKKVIGVYFHKTEEFYKKHGAETRRGIALQWTQSGSDMILMLHFEKIDKEQLCAELNEYVKKYS